MITRDRQEEQLKVGSGVDRQKKQRVQTNTAVNEVQALNPTATPVNRYVAPVVRQAERSMVDELLSGLSSLAPAVNKLYMAREEKLFTEAQKEAESKVQGMTFEEASAAVKSGELDQAANPYYQAAFNKTYGARAGIELKRKMAVAYENEFDKDSGNVDEFVSSFMAAQKEELGDNEFALQGFELATKDVREKFIGAQTDYDTQKKKTETNDSVFTVISESVAQLKAAGASPDVVSAELMKLGSGYKNTLGFEYADFDKLVMNVMSKYAEAGDVNFVNEVLDNKRGGLGALSSKTSLLSAVNQIKSTAIDQNAKMVYKSGMDLRFLLENQADTGNLDYKLARSGYDQGLLNEGDLSSLDAQNDSALKSLRKDNDKLQYKLEADKQYGDLMVKNIGLLVNGNSGAMKDESISDGTGGTKLYTVEQQKKDTTSSITSMYAAALQTAINGEVTVDGDLAQIIKKTSGVTLGIGDKIPVSELSKMRTNTMMYLGLEDNQTRGLFKTVYNRMNEGSFGEKPTPDFINMMSNLNHVFTTKGISGVVDYMGNTEDASVFQHTNDLIGQGYDQVSAFREAASFSRFYEQATPEQKSRAERVNNLIAVSLTSDNEISELFKQRFGQYVDVSAEVMQFLQRKAKINSVKAVNGANEESIARSVIMSLDATDLTLVDGYVQLVPNQLSIEGKTVESSRMFSEFKDHTLDELRGISGDEDVIVTLGNMDRDPSLIGDTWDAAVDWFTDRDPTRGLNREYIAPENMVWQRINGASGGVDTWRLVTAMGGSSLPVIVTNKKTGVRKHVEFTTDMMKKGWGSLDNEMTKAKNSMALSSMQGTQELRNIENKQYPLISRTSVKAINDLNEYHPVELLLGSIRGVPDKVKSGVRSYVGGVSTVVGGVNEFIGNTFPKIETLTEKTAQASGAAMRELMDKSEFPDQAELERLILNNQ
jgi:hypothetical protein